MNITVNKRNIFLKEFCVLMIKMACIKKKVFQHIFLRCERPRNETRANGIAGYCRHTSSLLMISVWNRATTAPSWPHHFTDTLPVPLRIHTSQSVSFQHSFLQFCRDYSLYKTYDVWLTVHRNSVWIRKTN